MRRVLRIGAVVLGVVGLSVCAAAVGIGWWAAVKTSDRIFRLSARLDEGLTKSDEQLARVELRLNAIRSDLSIISEAAESLASENEDLPRVRARIEQLIEGLVPALDRADATADSLRSLAVGLRTVADIVNQLKEDLDVTAGARNVADKIDLAAESLTGLRSRVDALKLDKVGQLTRKLIALAREAAAGSERLAEGLAAARHEIAVLRERITDRRDNILFWVYAAASANMLLFLWGGLGQLCLIGWGMKREKSNGRGDTAEP